MDDLREKAIKGLERCTGEIDCDRETHHNYCPYWNNGCFEHLIRDALSLLKEQEEAEEEASGTLDKLIKETQELLSKAPTDFDIVKGIIERSSLRKHFDEATIETGERIITLREGADEVDLLFDKDGRIE